jgi:hypothetical protein
MRAGSSYIATVVVVVVPICGHVWWAMVKGIP